MMRDERTYLSGDGKETGGYVMSNFVMEKFLRKEVEVIIP
jgi:hypothetical protein